MLRFPLQSTWDLTIHPLLGLSVLVGTRSPHQLLWDLIIHLFRGPASSLALVFLSNRCGISELTPFEAQRPCWHTFHSPINMRSYNPPLFAPSILAGTRFPLQSMWDLRTHPLRDPASSLALISLSNRCGIS